jgi:hypothetical protein
MSDTAILIQGPLIDGHFLPGGYWQSLADKIDYLNISEKVADYYSAYDNVLWSTWVDQDEKKIDYIRNANIDVLLSHYPIATGKQNINYQITSTLNGLNYIKEHLPNVKYVFKVRGDFIIEELNRVIDFCKAQSGLGFIMYRTDLQHPSDYCMFGEVDEMISFWSNVRDYNGRTPEDDLTTSYIHSKLGYPSKSLEDCMKVGYFFGKFIMDNNIKIQWLKYGYDPIRHALSENIGVTF